MQDLALERLTNLVLATAKDKKLVNKIGKDSTTPFPRSYLEHQNLR